MDKFKNYLKIFGYYFSILFIYLLIVSLFNYFELFNYKVLNIVSYIFILLLHAFLGIKVSRYERKKGYLNGFIIGLILVILFSIITIIISKFSLSTLIYYITLVLASMIGGIIGVPNEK